MADLIGRKLGHYLVAEKLGEGGMGEVFRARDERLERDVAIKVLPDEVADDEQRLARFEREARAVAALDHPNILAIHELGEHEGRPFIVTELLEGQSLRELIQDGSMTARKAMEYGVQIAEGLAAAHEKGIVHRDLKPANVFITGEGRAKILDFGLARVYAAETAAVEESEADTTAPGTKVGDAVGTVGYMSPEQVRGQEVDERSDIFSFGVVLYEMLTGLSPFRRVTPADSVSAILNEDPPPVSQTTKRAPAIFDGVVRRCLEKRPEDRFQSAQDVAFALQAVLQAPKVGRRDRPGPRVYRPMAFIPVILAAALAFALLIAGYKSLLRWSEEQAQPTGPPRIVVLPFVNLGPPEDEYFADGVTIEIINRLGAVSELHIISRTTAMNYRGTPKNIREIGEELGVDYALEGEVRWARTADGGGRVRITPQLIRIEDDSHLWATSYDREIEDIFAVQSDIAHKIIGELRVTLLEPERKALEARPTDNMEAYNAYLRGLGYHLGILPVELERAVAMFELAVELDPYFALAHALLSANHSWINLMGLDRTEDRMARARGAAVRALELDPQLPEAHLAMGWYHAGNGEFDEALQAYATADRLRPNDADVASAIAGVHLAHGRWQEAVIGYERALELDPQNYDSLYTLAFTLWRNRRYTEAVEVIDRAIAVAPDRPTAYATKHWIYRAWYGPSQQSRRVLEEVPAGVTGLEFNWFWQELNERNYEAAVNRLSSFPESVIRFTYLLIPISLAECWCHELMNESDRNRESCEAARVVLEEALGERPDDPAVHSSLGIVYAYLGAKESAVDHAERAMALAPVSETHFGVEFVENAAWALAEVGELDRALDLIDYLLSVPSTMTVPVLRLEPRWDPLRDHPRYREILDKYDQ